MGLLAGLVGVPLRKILKKQKRQLEDILTTTENVELAFSLSADLIVF